VAVLQDFWTADVAGLYALEGLPRRSETPLQLLWTREDRRAPGVRGTETLTLELPDLRAGRIYSLPADDVRAEYGMATPAKGQGARAVRLEGTVRVDEVTRTEVGVTLDLTALMTRLDVSAEFHETIHGSFRLRRGVTPLPAWASTR
jgi:hypothetical protein